MLCCVSRGSGPGSPGEWPTREGSSSSGHPLSTRRADSLNSTRPPSRRRSGWRRRYPVAARLRPRAGGGPAGATAGGLRNSRSWARIRPGAPARDRQNFAARARGLGVRTTLRAGSPSGPGLPDFRTRRLRGLRIGLRSHDGRGRRPRHAHAGATPARELRRTRRRGRVRSAVGDASIDVRGLGRADSSAAPKSAISRAFGRRFEPRRGPVTEWYVNGRRGLQQGFTIEAPPLCTRHHLGVRSSTSSTARRSPSLSLQPSTPKLESEAVSRTLTRMNL